jgi:hypothetical protein
MTSSRWFAACATGLILSAISVRAHDGPPFPILSDRTAGPYLISIWTDPDTTDDGSAGGQFWIRIHAVDKAAPPAGTRATVSVRPLDRRGSEQTAVASPVREDTTNQFAALLFDHEGRFAVHVAIDGPLGAAAAESSVDATYSVRPPRSLILLFIAPFVLIGLLWGRLLIRRYRMTDQRLETDKRQSD